MSQQTWIQKLIALYAQKQLKKKLAEEVKKATEADGVFPATPPAETEPDDKVFVLEDFRIGISDAEGKEGQFWFIPPPTLRGRIASVIIGDEPYAYERPYRLSELWYGVGKNGTTGGEIVIVTKDTRQTYKTVTRTIRIDSTPEDSTVTTGSNKIPSKTYRGRTNGNRPTWYFFRDLSTFPAVFWLTIPGHVTKMKIINGNRADGKGKGFTGNGYIVKQSDVNGRGMAILAPASCPVTPHPIYVEW